MANMSGAHLRVLGALAAYILIRHHVLELALLCAPLTTEDSRSACEGKLHLQTHIEKPQYRGCPCDHPCNHHVLWVPTLLVPMIPHGTAPLDEKLGHHAVGLLPAKLSRLGDQLA